jgi:hemerythrin superfamily protein
MDIFECLRADHARLKNLLDDLIEADAKSVPRIKMELKLAIIAHDRAEEEVVYEVLRLIPYRAELADLRTDEHFLNESVLGDLDDVEPDDEDWITFVDLFKNQLDSHFAEEETFVFSLLRDNLDEKLIVSMADDFEKRRNEIARQTKRYHPEGLPPINPAGLDLG